MKVYRKIYTAQKMQRCLTVTVAAWILSAVEISAVGLRLSAVLAAASVVLCILCLSKSNVAKKDMLHEIRELDTEKMNRVFRVLFFCCMSAAAVGVVLCALLCEKDFSSAYGTLIYIANVLLPLQLMFIPLYPKAVLRAAAESSVENLSAAAEPKRQILRGKNACLLVIAFLVSYFMMFYAAPTLYKGSAQFKADQDEVLKNDISAAFPYKSELLENCDIRGLLENLPGASELQSVSKGADTVTVSYAESGDTMKMHSEIVYNATALFALADNLREINFFYGRDTVTVLRANAVSCYDDFSQILNNWQMQVSFVLRKEETVEQKFSAMTETEKK